MVKDIHYRYEALGLFKDIHHKNETLTLLKDFQYKYVINKGYFSEAFLFKPRGGRSPPSGLNRKSRKNPLFSL